MRGKVGQAWGFDLMIGLVVFLSGMILFYFFSLNSPNEGQQYIDELLYEGNLVGDNLLSEGYPQDWEVGNVVRIGLTTNDKINQTKLNNLYNLTAQQPGGYQSSKALMNIKNEYFFNFSEQMSAHVGNIAGIGSVPPSNPRNLVKITRLTIYENEPVTINIFIWED